jgi:hypothetical protein
VRITHVTGDSLPQSQPLTLFSDTGLVTLVDEHVTPNDNVLVSRVYGGGVEIRVGLHAAGPAVSVTFTASEWQYIVHTIAAQSLTGNR